MARTRQVTDCSSACEVLMTTSKRDLGMLDSIANRMIPWRQPAYQSPDQEGKPKMTTRTECNCYGAFEGGAAAE